MTYVNTHCDKSKCLFIQEKEIKGNLPGNISKEPKRRNMRVKKNCMQKTENYAVLPYFVVLDNKP